MVAAQAKRSREYAAQFNLVAEPSIRLEIVDNWHSQWQVVLDSIDAARQRHVLMLDTHGWLSSRQTVIAAFDAEQAAGFVCFHVRPIRGSGGNGSKGRRPVLEAQLDSLFVFPTPSQPVLCQTLLEAAIAQSRQVNCRQFRDHSDQVIQ